MSPESLLCNPLTACTLLAASQTGYPNICLLLLRSAILIDSIDGLEEVDDRICDNGEQGEVKEFRGKVNERGADLCFCTPDIEDQYRY